MSDPNYLLIHVHIAYVVWALLAASEASTVSQQPRRSNLTSDLKSVTSISYLSKCILLIWYEPYLAFSKAFKASKQPQRSILTSDLKLVIPITYLSMCILPIYCMVPFDNLWGHYNLRLNMSSYLKSMTSITYGGEPFSCARFRIIIIEFSVYACSDT